MLAAGMDARSYARVLGANDRIRLAQLGCGARSHGHVHMVQLASRKLPVETVAVCDIWSLARERRAAQVKEVFNLDPKSYKYSEDLLARNVFGHGLRVPELFGGANEHRHSRYISRPGKKANHRA